MDLDKLRTTLDAIDADIVGLLNRRMELAVRARNLKTAILASDREQSVLSQARQNSIGLLVPEFTESLYKTIMEESRRLQALDLQLVGFQGEHGAHSERASMQLHETAIPIPHTDFSDVFDGVASGVLSLGVVPLENSLGGTVATVEELVMERDLHITSELYLPVQHCLLTLPGQALEDIRIVYSHPQALSQARRWLDKHEIESQPYYDTAGAALMLRRERPTAAGVLAGELCADLYQLDIIAREIADSPVNVTRFVTISREPTANGSKCSIVFYLDNKPGSLSRCLEILSGARINLTRIASRPAPGEPDAVAFLCDLQGSPDQDHVSQAFADLQQHASYFRLLGCYPESDPRPDRSA